MKTAVTLLIVIVSSFCYAASDGRSVGYVNGHENQVVSPDGQLEVNFKLTGKQPFYNVSYNGKAVLLDSTLGVVFESDPFD